MSAQRVRSLLAERIVIVRARSAFRCLEGLLAVVREDARIDRVPFSFTIHLSVALWLTSNGKKPLCLIRISVLSLAYKLQFHRAVAGRCA